MSASLSLSIDTTDGRLGPHKKKAYQKPMSRAAAAAAAATQQQQREQREQMVEQESLGGDSAVELGAGVLDRAMHNIMPLAVQAGKFSSGKATQGMGVGIVPSWNWGKSGNQLATDGDEELGPAEAERPDGLPLSRAARESVAHHSVLVQLDSSHPLRVTPSFREDQHKAEHRAVAAAQAQVQAQAQITITGSHDYPLEGGVSVSTLDSELDLASIKSKSGSVGKM
jgi:hypothetical protein